MRALFLFRLLWPSLLGVISCYCIARASIDPAVKMRPKYRIGIRDSELAGPRRRARLLSCKGRCVHRAVLARHHRPAVSACNASCIRDQYPATQCVCLPSQHSSASLGWTRTDERHACMFRCSPGSIAIDRLIRDRSPCVRASLYICNDACMDRSMASRSTLHSSREIN